MTAFPTNHLQSVNEFILRERKYEGHWLWVICKGVNEKIIMKISDEKLIYINNFSLFLLFLASE